MNRSSIHIRVASAADAAALLAIYAPYVEHTAITFEYTVPTLPEFESRIRRTLERYPWLVAEADGKIVGYAYAGPFKARAAYDWAVETTIYLKQGQTGRGTGRLLYQALERVLAAQGVLNLNACIAYPEPEDQYLTRNSAQFHRHLGYRLVGQFHRCGYKFGRWYDMVWMEKLIGPHLEHQPPVIPFPQMQASAEPILSLL